MALPAHCDARRSDAAGYGVSLTLFVVGTWAFLLIRPRDRAQAWRELAARSQSLLLDFSSEVLRYETFQLAYSRLFFRWHGSCHYAPHAIAQYIGGVPPVGTTILNFSVTGVASAAGLSTIFTCTNPSAVTVNVAVETFDHNGSAQNASPALSVPPGGTAQFATASTAPFVADQYLNPVSNFTRGAAKIWSNAKSIHCGAMLAAGGAGLADLPVIAQGKKQRGD